MALTGAQYELSGHGYRAVVTGVGAGLRVLTGDGVDLVETFGADEHPPMGAGGVLIPWPNRTAGARFRWDGTERTFEPTEPARGHAIHGLLRRETWTAVRHEADVVTLAADLAPGAGAPLDPPDPPGPGTAPGWPGALHAETTYSVGPDGLTVTHALTATGDVELPVGVGVHPYLRVGDVGSSDCVLTARTATVLDVDDLLIPTGPARPVTAGEDLSGGRRVGELDLDTGFGTGAPAGGSHHDLRAPDGSGARIRGTRLWADASFGWVQIFTPASPFGREGQAVAVEPMTCPPDALNSGVDLAVVAPGETWTVRWGIRALAADDAPAGGAR